MKSYSLCSIFFLKYKFNLHLRLTTLFCFISVFIPVLYAGKSWALFRRSCWVVQKLQQLLILAYSVFIRFIRKNNSCLFCFILLYSGFCLEVFFNESQYILKTAPRRGAKPQRKYETPPPQIIV